MGLLDDTYHCQNAKCDFRIGRDRFNDICYGKPPIARHERVKHTLLLRDNASDLNNMGHEVVADDFSDSPHREA
jgi:hypothetical protein